MRSRSNIEIFVIGAPEKVTKKKDTPTVSQKKRTLPDVKTKLALDEDLQKHKENLDTILLCSNATAIYRYETTGYMCGYCPDIFEKPSLLKTHTLSNHALDTNPKTSYSRSDAMKEFVVKLDITDLTCNICSKKINTLNDLLTHLNKEHNKIVHTDLKSHFLPFKFDTDRLTCCLCDNNYDSFKKLQEHMHSHFRNFVCDICGAGYVNQGRLTRHAKTHIKGTFPCNYCDKTYDTVIKKNSHERVYHVSSNVLSKCGYCDEAFKYHYMRAKHMTEVHGIKTGDYKCTACDNIYASAKQRNRHIKRHHLMERKHKCPLCDTKFFSKYDIKKHMVKHTGVKEFQCKICSKSYSARSSLAGHMRIHNNDRRFKCDVCGFSFVQKCSWKSHMKSKHDKIVS